MNRSCQDCPFMQSYTGKHSPKGVFRRVLKTFAAVVAAFIAANWNHLYLVPALFQEHEYGDSGFMEPGYSYVLRTLTEEHNARAELVQSIETSNTVRFLMPSGDVYVGRFDSAKVLWSGKIKIRNGSASFTLTQDKVKFFNGEDLVWPADQAQFARGTGTT